MWHFKKKNTSKCSFRNPTFRKKLKAYINVINILLVCCEKFIQYNFQNLYYKQLCTDFRLSRLGKGLSGVVNF